MEYVSCIKLPVFKPWKDIVRYLVTREDGNGNGNGNDNTNCSNNNISIRELANSILNACDLSFSGVGNDVLFHEVVYLLFQMVRVPIGELEGVGVDIPSSNGSSKPIIKTV